MHHAYGRAYRVIGCAPRCSQDSRLAVKGSPNGLIFLRTAPRQTAGVASARSGANLSIAIDKDGARMFLEQLPSGTLEQQNGANKIAGLSKSDHTELAWSNRRGPLVLGRANTVFRRPHLAGVAGSFPALDNFDQVGHQRRSSSSTLPPFKEFAFFLSRSCARRKLPGYPFLVRASRGPNFWSHKWFVLNPVIQAEGSRFVVVQHRFRASNCTSGAGCPAVPPIHLQNVRQDSPDGHRARSIHEPNYSEGDSPGITGLQYVPTKPSFVSLVLGLYQIRRVLPSSACSF